MSINDIDLYEVNEAFAPVPLAWAQAVGADKEKIAKKKRDHKIRAHYLMGRFEALVASAGRLPPPLVERRSI